MIDIGNVRRSLPSQIALVALATALSFTAQAQQPDASATSTSSAAQTSATQATAQNSAQDTPQLKDLSKPAREGFWGRVNPFARKKWVRRQLEPVKGQVNELNEVNAKNSQDIKDVDQRAQAGISKAQSAADAANQTATTAGEQAQQANGIAGQASSKVQQLTGTVNGLDQYAQKETTTIDFRPGQMTLSDDAKKELDGMAANLKGKQGFVLEMTAYALGAGVYGIQNSRRLAEVVERYLVTQDDIPVYRMHAVALGNAAEQTASGTTAAADNKPARVTRHVEVRLMENTLAATDGTTPR